MVKGRKEEKCDDIEIRSIGKLYTGQWNKKYWSSSRGKDRYPYPIGYTSLRILNDITYKMEILQGLKGPLFTITSSDGNSSSGDTPDIALETFQKIKFRRGNRFTCKMDGVELYGFKNPFVQRLLRELVADVSGTERRWLNSNVESRGPNTVGELRNGELVTVQVQTKVTRKRSGISEKVISNKRLAGTYSNQNQRGDLAKEVGVLNSERRGKSDGVDSDTSVATDMCIAGRGAQFDHPEGQISISEETDGDCKVEHGMSVDANLFAPDTLDQAGGNLCASFLDYESKSKIFLTDSQPEDERGTSDSCTFSQNCDNDSIGQEVAKSMMAFLLPQAIPLLKTFTRKKRKSSKPESISDHGCQEKDNVPNSSRGDEFKSRELVEQSNISSTDHDSLVSTSGYTHSVVPDSLDNNDPVNCIPNTSKGDKESNGFDTCAQLTIGTNGDAKTVLCFSETKKYEINLHSRAQSSWSEKFPKGHDSLVSTSGYTQSVVPDSLDNDNPVDSVSNTSKGYKDSNGLETHAQLDIGTNEDANTMLCLSETKMRKINLQSQARSSSSEKPPTGPILAQDVEIVAYSRRRKNNCPSIDKPPSLPASIAKPSPGLKSTNYKSPANADFSKSFEARVTEKLPNVADLDDHGRSTLNLQDSSAVNYHNMSVNGEIKSRSRFNIQKLNSNPRGLLDLLAVYVLPVPISAVQLIVKEDDVYVCVECCSLELKRSTLFFYKAPKRGENIGCPSLIGYLPLGLESSKDTLGGDSAVDNSIFQFIPDAQFLILSNNIKTPFCREGKLHCLCSACTSDCLEKNAVKIVQINSGYASLVTRLETAQDVRCLLVCEPGFLLAADEGGKLKLWTMNSSWSAQMEHCYLPTHGSMFPRIVELKGVPKSTFLVIGHNGLGEFGLWDIEKRTLVSRFSSPGMSVSRCIPACHLKWQRSGDHRREKLIGEIMDATKISFAERNENHNFPVEDKDSAIWLLISTVSDPDSQCYQSSEQQQENPVEYWRLALLVNNTVIVGSALDSGAAAVTSAGRGIIGTCDGLVYIWELSTGTKLGNLHSFKGSDSSVSCITSDTSNSGAVAIASGSQLLVYLPS